MRKILGRRYGTYGGFQPDGFRSSNELMRLSLCAARQCQFVAKRISVCRNPKISSDTTQANDTAVPNGHFRQSHGKTTMRRGSFIFPKRGELFEILDLPPFFHAFRCLLHPKALSLRRPYAAAPQKSSGSPLTRTSASRKPWLAKLAMVDLRLISMTWRHIALTRTRPPPRCREIEPYVIQRRAMKSLDRPAILRRRLPYCSSTRRTD